MCTDYDFRFVRCHIYRPYVQERIAEKIAGWQVFSLHILGLLIVLYGLEGWYLHVPVWMVQKFAPLKEGGRVKCLRSKNPK